MGTPVQQGHVAWHPGVADIGKVDYLKWCILGGIDVLSLPLMERKLDRITSEARTSIEFEISITHRKATVIERIAALEVVREEVRIINVNVFHDLYVGLVPILGIVNFDAMRAYLFKMI